MGQSHIIFHTCANGCIHISVGNITINLAKNDFFEFAKRMSEYASNLKGEKSVVLEFAKKN